MQNVNESVEARLAPEIIGLMFFVAVMSIDLGIGVLSLSSYTSCRQCTPRDNFDFYLFLLTVVWAGFLFSLAYTWCLRILPVGVEVRYLCVRKVWHWNDFLEAEAGHHQIYFRTLPPWKRYLGCGFLDPVTAKQILERLLERVPPVKKWNGPLTLETWPRAQFTFLDEGIRVRRCFRTRFLSWDDLHRALVFQSPVSDKGFLKLHLIFDKRTYRFTNVRAFRGQHERPTCYDVLDFLISHVPKEKLVFIDLNRSPRSHAECEERKKILRRMKATSILLGVLAAFVFLCCCAVIYDAADVLYSHGGILTVRAIIMLLGSVVFVCHPLAWGRATRDQERLLKQGQDALNSTKMNE